MKNSQVPEMVLVWTAGCPSRMRYRSRTFHLSSPLVLKGQREEVLR